MPESDDAPINQRGLTAAPAPQVEGSSPGSRLRELGRRWLGRTDFVVLVVALCVAAALWGFTKVAHWVSEGRTQPLDDWVVKALRNPDNPRVPRGPAWFVESVRDVTALGSPIVVALTLATVAGYLALTKRYRAMLLAIGASIGGGILSELLKDEFQRPRPPFPSDITHPFSSSFPSGHSLLSAMVYLLLGAMLAKSEPRWAVKLYFVAVAMTLTFLVGASRVILGVHYPSDVLAGWVAGLGWACAGWLTLRWWERRAGGEK